MTKDKFPYSSAPIFFDFHPVSVSSDGAGLVARTAFEIAHGAASVIFLDRRHLR